MTSRALALLQSGWKQTGNETELLAPLSRKEKCSQLNEIIQHVLLNKQFLFIQTVPGWFSLANTRTPYRFSVSFFNTVFRLLLLEPR